MISYLDFSSNDFSKKPITIRVNRITEESVINLEKALSDVCQYKQPILPIIIDSNGGCAYSLIAMAEMIRESGVVVATIVESRAMSCGAVLFTCGNQGYRFISKNGILMMHDVRTNNNGKVEDVKSDAAEANRLNNILYEMMAYNCGKQPSYFKDIMHENSHADLYFNAEECIKHNLANHIKIPRIKGTVSIKYDLI